MCGFVTTLGGGLCGFGIVGGIAHLCSVGHCGWSTAAPLWEEGLTFGVGWEFSYTCVYVEFLKDRE